MIQCQETVLKDAYCMLYNHALRAQTVVIEAASVALGSLERRPHHWGGRVRSIADDPWYDLIAIHSCRICVATRRPLTSSH